MGQRKKLFRCITMGEPIYSFTIHTICDCSHNPLELRRIASKKNRYVSNRYSRPNNMIIEPRWSSHNKSKKLFMVLTHDVLLAAVLCGTMTTHVGRHVHSHVYKTTQRSGKKIVLEVRLPDISMEGACSKTMGED